MEIYRVRSPTYGTPVNNESHQCVAQVAPPLHYFWLVFFAINTQSALKGRRKREREAQANHPNFLSNSTPPDPLSDLGCGLGHHERATVVSQGW